jgi:hypothetical protein
VAKIEQNFGTKFHIICDTKFYEIGIKISQNKKQILFPESLFREISSTILSVSETAAVSFVSLSFASLVFIHLNN